MKQSLASCCLGVTASDQEEGLHDTCLSSVSPESRLPQAKAVLGVKEVTTNITIWDRVLFVEKNPNNSLLNSVLKLIKKLYQGISVPWEDPKILGASGKSVGSTTYLNIKAQSEVTASLLTSTCLLPCVRASTQNYKMCNLFDICHTFYPTDSSTYHSLHEGIKLRGMISLLSTLGVSWKKNLVCPSISSVGVRCIIDLPFLSHCWKTENNPAAINTLLNFSDFNDRHWCSCHLTCSWWPKASLNFKAKWVVQSSGWHRQEGWSRPCKPRCIILALHHQKHWIIDTTGSLLINWM